MENKRGLIVIGYQGIGKTSLASDISNKVIDFESSLFKQPNGLRRDDWYVTYCKQAISIANQGFVVCTSSHKSVRQEFEKTKPDTVDILSVYPSLELKDLWIKRLRQRHLVDMSEKNTAALIDAMTNYEKSIEDMENDILFYKIVLESTNYRLFNLIYHFCKENELEYLMM